MDIASRITSQKWPGIKSRNNDLPFAGVSILGIKLWTAVWSRITILDNRRDESWDAMTFSGNKNNFSDKVVKKSFFSSNSLTGKSVRNSTIFRYSWSLKYEWSSIVERDGRCICSWAWSRFFDRSWKEIVVWSYSSLDDWRTSSINTPRENISLARWSLIGTDVFSSNEIPLSYLCGLVFSKKDWFIISNLYPKKLFVLAWFIISFWICKIWS